MEGNQTSHFLVGTFEYGVTLTLDSKGWIRSGKEESRAKVTALVDRYSRVRDELLFAASGFSETDTRNQFVDPLLAALGWDVKNEAGRFRSQMEVVTERSEKLKGKGGTGRPDYKLRINGRDVMPVEAKKISAPLEIDASFSRQARSYGWSLSLPASVLTNFESLVVFDTTIEPRVEDGVNVARIPTGTFRYDEYVSRFDDLWNLLSYESLLTEGLEGIYNYEVPPRGASPFDRAFLGDVRRWRLELATSVAQENPDLGSREVSVRTQKILNALFFLRVCEDRNLRKYEELKESSRIDNVVQLFREADRVYNAGLFPVLSTTVVNSSTLNNLIEDMYWPRSHYAYGVMDPEVMAGMYDQYLSEHLVVGEQREVSVRTKPEVLHSGGVVSTPEYIVREIVESTLEMDDCWAEFPNVTPRIVDPAVGSGTFLIETFKYLLDKAELNGTTPSFEVRSKIATDCLFGIDIDPAAVEVARLSVLLLVLGGGEQEDAAEMPQLPSLNANIIVGNSVVREDFDDLVPMAAKDINRRAAVKPLTPFGIHPGSKEGLKFDFLVCNPPYIRIQELSKFAADQLTYFQHPKSGYECSQGNSFDTYQVFVERALELVKKKGRIGMIIPNRFTTSLPAAPIRLQIGKRLERMIHFRENQVFPGRLTYVAIVILGEGRDSSVEIRFVDDLELWRKHKVAECRQISRKELGPGPWPMATELQAQLFRALESNAVARLGDPGWMNIFVGVQTSADDYYFLKPVSNRDGVATFVDKLGEESKVEEALLRPAIRDRMIDVYDGQPEPDFYAIFPYQENEKGRYEPIPVETMRDRFPNAWKYFEKFRERLSPPNRNISPDPGEKVWAYGRSQSLNKLSEPKLIVRTLSLVPRYALDLDGLLVPGGGDGGPYYLLRPEAECRYSIDTLQAILSHPVVDLYVAVNGKKFHGSYASHRKEFLKLVPLPELSTQQRKQIDLNTRELRDLAERLRIETDTSLRESMTQRRRRLSAQNHAVISEAFGLREEDIRRATGST